jgi:hypothetical protein
LGLAQITPEAVISALEEFDRLGRAPFLERYGFGSATTYVLVRDGKEYDSKAILGVAHQFAVPAEGPLHHEDFNGGEAGAKSRLEALGFEVRVRATAAALSGQGSVEAERARRQEMWAALTEGGGSDFSPATVRELGLYGGQQGIWVDTERTSAVAPYGVTVSILHRGTRYADDLWEDGLLYHYPSTQRGSRDQAEIEATKAAKRLGLPLFVVTNSTMDATKRAVRMAWIEDWDDGDQVFLVRFGEVPPAPRVIPTPEAPFKLEDEARKRTALVETRLGQQRFKLDCIAYYGAECAVCDMALRPLLDGAHIRPKKERGADDPRNGLILCASHHRAYDAGLFAIEPESLRIITRDSGPSLAEMQITRTALTHLARKPRVEALQWAWGRSTQIPDAASETSVPGSSGA